MMERDTRKMSDIPQKIFLCCQKEHRDWFTPSQMVAQRVSFCNRMEGGSPIHYMIKVYSLAEPVNTKEYVKCGKYRPFIVVHKRVTVQQAFQQDVSLFHTIGVIAALKPIGGLHRAISLIPEAQQQLLNSMTCKPRVSAVIR